jgi:hypothetical protein
MKTTSSAIYLIAISVLGIALSCGANQTNVDAESSKLTAAPSPVPRTSSDMNITTPNMQTPDPMYDGHEPKSRADSLELNKPND